MSRSGEQAEALAADFLRGQGLRIVARNYRSRYGEIDLIVREGATVVFVEVRSRSSETYGGAAASITAAKREKLIKTAHHYLAGVSPLPPCRFDAVLVSGEPPRIEWIRNAIEG
ncbi:MAG: YraN family protein [Burkholderiales bacterium]|jgi:putative endonuclease|nr:YraN family protein [Burkholderiales bacterium]